MLVSDSSSIYMLPHFHLLLFISYTWLNSWYKAALVPSSSLCFLEVFGLIHCIFNAMFLQNSYKVQTEILHI